jgi:hypothetical protein
MGRRLGIMGMKTLTIFLSFFLVAEVFGASPAFTGFRGSGVILATTNTVAGTVTYSGQPYILTNGQVSAVTFNTSLTLGAVGSVDSFRLSYNAGTPSLDVFNTFSGLVQFSFLESGINQSVVDLTVPDEVYGVAWDGSLEVPTKNALFDKIQTLVGGGGGTNFDSIIVTNQIINGQDFISGNMVATNIDFSLGMVYANSTNTVVDPVFSATNLIPSITSLFVLGQTNGATNHTITLTNSLGAKFIYFNGTNGSFTATLFSNSWMRFTMQVVTNATDTNIFVTTEGNSGWPQRNQPLIIAAGGSRSNVVAGGMYYVDTLPAYTNINSTIGTYTNLSTNVVAGLLSTNNWDMYYHRWGLKFRSGFSTNGLQVVFGSETIFDAGVFTNNTDSGYVETRIWRTGPTSGHAETTLFLGFCSLLGGGTNRNVEISQTNGIDTILQLKGASSRFMSFTNNSSYGEYKPVSKG